MRVIKTRGSAHALHPYRLDIDGDGIHVTKMSSSDVRQQQGGAGDKGSQA